MKEGGRMQSGMGMRKGKRGMGVEVHGCSCCCVLHFQSPQLNRSHPLVVRCPVASVCGTIQLSPNGMTSGRPDRYHTVADRRRRRRRCATTTQRLQRTTLKAPTHRPIQPSTHSLRRAFHPPRSTQPGIPLFHNRSHSSINCRSRRSAQTVRSGLRTGEGDCWAMRVN